jgi:hypothetical protein
MRAGQHEQEERPPRKAVPTNAPHKEKEGSAMLRPYRGSARVRAYFVWSCFVDSRKTWPTMARVLGLILSRESCGVCQ